MSMTTARESVRKDTALDRPLSHLLAEITAVGGTVRLCGARVALGGNPLPACLKQALRDRRDELWRFLGGPERDAPALALMGTLAVEPVLVDNEGLAERAVREVFSDAQQHGGTLGIDIETAALPQFSKPRPIRLTSAGRIASHQPSRDDRVPLDPHRSRMMTVQLFGGGSRAYVFPARCHGILWNSGLLERHLVAHNAAFEWMFIQATTGKVPMNMECTMQAAGLMLGVHRRSLAAAALAYLDLEVPKQLQTSDWAAPEMSIGQIAYAAADAVLAWRLWQRLEHGLRDTCRWAAYEVQRAVIPAVVDMQLRGFRLDIAEHARQVNEWSHQLAETRRQYVELTGCPPPTTPAEVRKWLQSVLPANMLAAWPRTTGGQLSTARDDLLRAAEFPSTRPVLDTMATEKLLSSFGMTLKEQVNPVTGRLHASYNIAAAKSGRFSASSPNLQQVPSRSAPRFKACFAAEAGKVLVGCDWNQIEMRAAAWISGDAALTEVYERGGDLHSMNAAAIAGCAVTDVTPEMRQAAKAVGFGSIYGMSANGLVAAAWSGYGVAMSKSAAQQALDRFFRRYHMLDRWRRRNFEECRRRGRVNIGAGRVVDNSWEMGGLRFTQCCNLPIQGVCADAMMLAMGLVHLNFQDDCIHGGLVAVIHDEIIVEVVESDSARARVILETAMIEAFSAIFPGAPTMGLVAAKVGRTWAEIK